MLLIDNGLMIILIRGWFVYTSIYVTFWILCEISDVRKRITVSCWIWARATSGVTNAKLKFMSAAIFLHLRTFSVPICTLHMQWLSSTVELYLSTIMVYGMHDAMWSSSLAWSLSSHHVSTVSTCMCFYTAWQHNITPSYDSQSSSYQHRPVS